MMDRGSIREYLVSLYEDTTGVVFDRCMSASRRIVDFVDVSDGRVELEGCGPSRSVFWDIYVLTRGRGLLLGRPAMKTEWNTVFNNVAFGTGAPKYYIETSRNLNRVFKFCFATGICRRIFRRINKGRPKI